MSLGIFDKELRSEILFDGTVVLSGIFDPEFVDSGGLNGSVTVTGISSAITTGIVVLVATANIVISGIASSSNIGGVSLSGDGYIPISGSYNSAGIGSVDQSGDGNNNISGIEIVSTTGGVTADGGSIIDGNITIGGIEIFSFMGDSMPHGEIIAEIKPPIPDKPSWGGYSGVPRGKSWASRTREIKKDDEEIPAEIFVTGMGISASIGNIIIEINANIYTEMNDVVKIQYGKVVSFADNSYNENLAILYILLAA